MPTHQHYHQPTIPMMARQYGRRQFLVRRPGVAEAWRCWGPTLGHADRRLFQLRYLDLPRQDPERFGADGTRTLPLVEALDNDRPPTYRATTRRTPEQVALARSLAPFLQRLTPGQLDAVRLVYFEGMTEADAADALGVTRSGLRSRLVKAVAALRRDLVADFPLGGPKTAQ